MTGKRKDCNDSPVEVDTNSCITSDTIINIVSPTAVDDNTLNAIDVLVAVVTFTSKNGDKENTKDRQCPVIKYRNSSYVILDTINDHYQTGVKVYRAGVVDYQEYVNKYKFDTNIPRSNRVIIKVSPSSRYDLEHETKIYKLLHPHPFIVNFFAGCLQCPDGKKCIILKCMDMDLLTCANHKGSSWFTIEEIRSIFKQVLLGLSHMHQRRVFHRDVSMENVCINKDNGKYTAKLMDFGLSIELNSIQLGYDDDKDDDDNKAQQGIKVDKNENEKGFKELYDAPELSDANIKYYYPDKRDIFALGVIFYILLVRDYPWCNGEGTCKSQDLIKKYIDVARKKINDKSAVELLEGMLRWDPQDRMPLDAIINHQWFTV